MTTPFIQERVIHPECFITPCELYNLLQDAARSKLVLDVRPESSAFEECAIRTSVHFTIDTFEPMKLWTKDIFSNKELIHCNKYAWSEGVCTIKESNDFAYRGSMYHIVVVVDDDGDGIFARTVSELLRDEGKVQPTHVLLLKGGIKAFQAKYSYMCSSKIRHMRSSEGSLPTEIVDSFVYLGSYDNATNFEQLSTLGITHILNMGDELENKFPDHFEYLKCNLDDTSSNNIVKFCDRCINFIDGAKLKEGGGKVLIHCAMGISRSSSIAIAYLMKTYLWTFDTANEYIRSQRTSIRPNPGFTQQLLEWQKTLLLVETIEKIKI